MSSSSIMPLFYILNVALIQIPISKRVADPQNVWMIILFSETESQIARMREDWVPRCAVCAPGTVTNECMLGWGLRAPCFLSCHNSPKEFLKLHFGLVKYYPHLIDCTPACFAERKSFNLPTTNIIFKEQLRLFHFPSKLRWAQTSNILSSLFRNKIWQVIGF